MSVACEMADPQPFPEPLSNQELFSPFLPNLGEAYLLPAGSNGSLVDQVVHLNMCTSLWTLPKSDLKSCLDPPGTREQMHMNLHL